MCEIVKVVFELSVILLKTHPRFFHFLVAYIQSCWLFSFSFFNINITVLWSV